MDNKKIYYDYESVTANANDSAEVNAFEVSRKEPRTVLDISVNANTASVYLECWDEREKFVSIPLDTIGLVDKWIPVNRPIEEGHKFQVGIRNATGAAVTVAIAYRWVVTE